MNDVVKPTKGGNTVVELSKEQMQDVRIALGKHIASLERAAVKELGLGNEAIAKLVREQLARVDELRRKLA